MNGCTSCSCADSVRASLDKDDNDFIGEKATGECTSQSRIFPTSTVLFPGSSELYTSGIIALVGRLRRCIRPVAIQRSKKMQRRHVSMYSIVVRALSEPLRGVGTVCFHIPLPLPRQKGNVNHSESAMISSHSKKHFGFREPCRPLFSRPGSGSCDTGH